MSVVVHARSKHLVIVAGFVLPLALVNTASAQGTGGAAPAGGAPAGVPPGATVTGTSTTMVQGPTTIQNFPGGVAPLQAGQTLGGGNVQFSSSKPITGAGDRDTFDFHPGQNTTTVHGGENSSFVLGSGVSGSPASTPGVHVVRKGDTLWAICDGYFRNPYQWPRIWSYNPQIQNPHWIYPGDQVRLRGGTEAVSPATPATPTGPGIVDRRRAVPPDTIFLRNEGFIDDDKNTNWGEISGSPEDKMILTDLDEAYLRVAGDKDVKVGQELTVYRPIKSVAGGKLIEIQGTVKVDQWNPKERIARAQVTESLDAIERGARIGPIQRRFEVVPPLRNEQDADATILASVVPHVFYGQNQLVFLDKGEEAGLKPGNRMFVLKKGDAWHASLTTKSSAKRIALESESPAATENVPKPRSDEALPEEVQAELRVINVKKKTSMAIVTTSRREIEQGDKAYLRKGY